MSKMHDTVVQDVFSRSWKKEVREREREKKEHDNEEQDSKDYELLGK